MADIDTPVATEPYGPHMRRCSRCGKTFSSRKGADDHIRMLHKGKGQRVSVIREDEEESLADIAIEAEIKRACGEELDPLEESLLP
jgi:uncharacterized C2H2 Zn-finger protein